MSELQPITRLLHSLGDGDSAALDELMPLVYAELKRIASQQLRRGGRQGGLQTTALVHELYERLMRGSEVKAVSRKHFYALCAKAMRQHIVDLARRRGAQKRGGGEADLPFQESDWAEPGSEAALLKLGEVLDQLEQSDPRAVRCFELVHLIGEDPKSVAASMDTSVRTVQREVARVRALFLFELEQRED